MRKMRSIQKWITYRKDDSGEEICYVTLEGLARLTHVPMTSVRRMQEEGLIAPIRGEERFADANALVTQIGRDVAAARAALAERTGRS